LETKQPFFAWRRSLNLPGHGRAAVQPYPLKTRQIANLRICNNGLYLFIGKGQKMALSCEEYRHQQQLLALNKRLTEDKLTPEEREEIERMVRELEKKLKI
jgi:hypothetical protein